MPPDAFSETGQDWGLPVYRWDVFLERDFDWLRNRARRNADLYDGYRVDHLVGFYRTFIRPHDGGESTFTPPSCGRMNVR
ncbi:4-alpha-glucanotransferase [compost metagenome]